MRRKVKTSYVPLFGIVSWNFNCSMGRKNAVSHINCISCFLEPTRTVLYRISILIFFSFRRNSAICVTVLIVCILYTGKQLNALLLVRPFVRPSARPSIRCNGPSVTFLNYGLFHLQNNAPVGCNYYVNKRCAFGKNNLSYGQLLYICIFST